MALSHCGEPKKAREREEKGRRGDQRDPELKPTINKKEEEKNRSHKRGSESEHNGQTLKITD